MAQSFIKIEYEGDFDDQPKSVGLRIPYEDIDDLVSAHEYLTRYFDDTDDPDAQQSREFLDRFWNEVWGIIPSLKHVTEQSTAKAQEVFGTTELLEEMLSYLDTKDKLKAMRVQRHWRDTVNGSVMLLRALGLESYDDGRYYSALSNRFQGRGYGRTRLEPGIRNPGFCYDDKDPKFFRWDQDSHSSFWTMNHRQEGLCEDPTQLQICLTMSTDPAKLRFGSRVAAMRIANPLVRQLRATIVCECRPSNYNMHGVRLYRQEDCHIVSTASEQGFTLGELADYTLKFAASHKGCKIPRIGYAFFVTLREGDVVMIQRREAEKEADALREVRRAEWLDRQAAEEEEERLEDERYRYVQEVQRPPSLGQPEQGVEDESAVPQDLRDGSDRDQEDADDAQDGATDQVLGTDEDGWEVLSVEVAPASNSTQHGGAAESTVAHEQRSDRTVRGGSMSTMRRVIKQGMNGAWRIFSGRR
ncbi:hypothetical protein HII31_12828 [Pseudocercospora fuligena]|uniref:F-box domain-containing protein n=1 Tax=Pseudocercospora fuligena TaxID=685502 RepID=A0A8H6R650_9PEZI|nr:hypothetical protein HII31_12828 [Pseudocercospora fuligena]